MAFNQARRKFIQFATLSFVFMWAGCRWFQKTASRFILGPLQDPLRKIGHEDLSRTQFAGDQFSRAHQYLWTKTETFQGMGGRPKASEKAKVVVVGGGISGLSSTYYLRGLGPILLEQGEQFGGNSRGESFEGSLYSIGAAYVVPSEKDSPSYQLMSALGILEGAKSTMGVGTILFGNRVRENLWTGVSDPAQKKSFEQAFKILKYVYDHEYPEVPFQKFGALSEKDFFTLDRMLFNQWIEKKIPHAHRHLKTFLEGYCYSAFSAGTAELSAAQALSFVSSDVLEVKVYPGGNSFIAQKLLERLKQTLPEGSLRPESLVVDIQLKENGVLISYVDREQKWRAIEAETCVVCSPKFVAAKLIDQMQGPQRDAIKQLKYRSMLVGNLILNKKISSPAYDLFNLQQLLRSSESEKLTFTDLIFAGWAQGDQVEHSVLTFYKPLPYDGGRKFLYGENSFDLVKKEIENGIPSVLRALNLTDRDILGLRLARWGHPIPIASPGLLADRVVDRAHQTIDSRVYFANQDNWANPCFETAVHAAHAATKSILTRSPGASSIDR